MRHLPGTLQNPHLEFLVPRVQLHGSVLLEVQVHLEGILQDVRLVHALGLLGVEDGSVKVLSQLVLVVWVSTLVDDLDSSLSRTHSSEVGQTLLGDNDIQVVLGLVNVWCEWHNTRHTGRVDLGRSGRRSVHDGQLGVSQEVGRSTKTVQHTGAHDVGGVGVGVHVNLDRGVHGDDTQSSDDLRRVGHNLRSETQLLGELVPTLVESVETSLGQSDGGGSGEVQGARVEEVKEGVLQDLGPHSQVLEVGLGQALHDGVGNVTNTGLQRQQVCGQSAHLDLVLEELDQVGTDLLRHGVRRSVGRHLVTLGRLHNGHDLGWVHRNGGAAHTVVGGGVRVRQSVWRVDGHVDIVDTLERRRLGVDLNDDLVRDRDHLGRATDGRTRHNGAVLGDGRGLDDRVVEKVVLLVLGVVAVGKILGEHGQMLVEEHGSSVVDGLGDWLADLMRRSTQKHVEVGPSGLLGSRRSTHEQVERELSLQVVLLDVVGQCLWNNLGRTDTGETRPSQVLAVLEELNTLFGGSQLGQVWRVSDSLLQKGRHFTG